MEQHGTGGPSLEPRVRQLESNVDALHQDSVKTQHALGILSGQVNGLSDGMKDIAVKLDQQRTRRPELGQLAAVAAVILTIGALVTGNTTSRIERVDMRQTAIAEIVLERAKIIGEFSADRDHLFQELNDLRTSITEMQKDRFTKQDGNRLENKVDRLHQTGD